jgi:uncharacterized repeat protein (TIGR01451 family)
LTLAASKEPDDSMKYYIALKNTGNKKDVLEMSFSSTQSLAWKFYKDVNDNGVFDGGDGQLTNTNGLAGVDADSVQFSDSVHVFAIAVVPSSATDQATDVTTFTVTSAGDNTKFASVTATTTYAVPVVTVTKNVAPLGNQPPGQLMTYTISYQNTGHGNAYNFTVTDSAPDSTTYAPGTIKLNNVAKTDAADADEATLLSGKNVSVHVGTLAPGASGTILFKITIN